MAELLLTRGVPASGKTTFAQFWLAQGQNRARVNRDELRFELYGTYWGDEVDENVVTKIQHSRVKALLEAGFDVVVDDTNLRAKTVKAWLKVAQEAGATVRHEDFPIEEWQANSRDQLRGSQPGGRMVGPEVIKKFYRFMGKGGAFPEFPVLGEATAQFEPYVPGRIPAYSFDMDGTLAHMSGRSPYDPTQYNTDTPDIELRELMNRLLDSGTDFDIIILTGRSAEYRESCEEWLDEHGFYFDNLLMRAEGDTRNDAIVKSELVDQYISNVYDVRIHFDDRNRVVDALRAKGMKVAQIAPGDF